MQPESTQTLNPGQTRMYVHSVYAGLNINNRIFYRSISRIYSFILSLFGLIFLSPVFLFLAILIKLDSSGSIFFKQLRTGKHGRRFYMYKFRTMYNNAEEMKANLLKFNKLSWPDFKMENDPRITKVGAILRKWSIDELPNLINIVKGDMNLVGPRPTSFPPGQYKEWQKARLAVTPGITGLWQVNGRSDVDFDDRVRMDIAYINGQSFTLDAKIILATFKAVFTKQGAY